MVGWCAWWGYKKNWLSYSLCHGGRFTSGEPCLQCPEQWKVPPVVPITLCSSMYSEQTVFSYNFLSCSTKACSPVWINGLGNRLFPPILSSPPSTFASLSPPFLDSSWETCTFWRHLSWPHCLKRGWLPTFLCSTQSWFLQPMLGLLPKNCWAFVYLRYQIVSSMKGEIVPVCILTLQHHVRHQIRSVNKWVINYIS